MNIKRISGCFPKLNIAKSGFYNCLTLPSPGSRQFFRLAFP